MASNRPINTPYVVVLPHSEFKDILPIDQMEITRATSPESAITNIISRGCNHPKKNSNQRNRAIGSATNKLKRDFGRDIGIYAFEVAEEISEYNQGLIPGASEIYDQSRLYFMADELTKGYDPDPIENLDIARKVLDFYDMKTS